MTQELKISLAGLSHRATVTTREELAREVPLKVKLVREPENSHDDNAIAVIVIERPYEDWQIGYVPRQVAALLAPLFDERKQEVQEAWVTAIEPITSTADMIIRLRRPVRKSKKPQR